MERPTAQVVVRAMRETDAAEASAIFRLAFGTFLRVPDPATFSSDREYIVNRWRADPAAALVAEVDGRLAGSNLMSHWGSFGFFGPLTVKPELWNCGVAQSLVAAAIELFKKRGVKEAGLFTFAASAKHCHLYQRFGFWPRFLTAVMQKPIESVEEVSFSKYNDLKATQREYALDECRLLADSLLNGLDVSVEIRAVAEQQLGDTIMLWGEKNLDAFAVCHCGAGTEAGSDCCYVKFAAVRASAKPEAVFERLLQACERLGWEHGLKKLEAGVNLARSEAYRSMLQGGFRTEMQGVAMHWNDSPGYNRPNVYVLDDWR